MPFTNHEILKIARRQSAIDLNCAPEDFLREEHVIVHSAKNANASAFLREAPDCYFVSYGNNVVASVSERCEEIVRAYLADGPAERCFETPKIHDLDDALAPLGLRSCIMGECFLPDVEILRPLPCAYELRVLFPAQHPELYTGPWHDALTEHAPERDVLAVGAYDGGRLIGLAGCSADCEMMWQIGVDVLPEYRRQGVASAVTSRLAVEILARSKVPFYCAAWSNVRSVRNAIRCGFRPSWVELTCKPIE